MNTLDSFIGTLTIIAAFSVVYERVQELIRAPRAALEKAKMLGLVELIDTLTIGSFNWVSGVVVALLTRADLLTLMSSQEKFLNDSYLKGVASTWEQIMGCILMGLAAAQGARYWHDMLGHMIDLRTQLKHVTGGIGAASAQLVQAAQAPDRKHVFEQAAGEIQRAARANGTEQTLGPVVEALQKVAASGEGAARPSAGS
jgi:hypothetical protein